MTLVRPKEVILAARPGLYRRSFRRIYTGARISELLALRWQDVKLESSIVEIRRTVSTARVKGETSPEKHRWFDPKTRQGIREIPIGLELVQRFVHGKKNVQRAGSNLVFSNEFGEPCNRTGVGRNMLTPALEQAKIEKAVTPHGLRHTYASMLILLKRPIPEISRYLGHADVGITMKVYAHFLKTKKQDTMSDLEMLIQNG